MTEKTSNLKFASSPVSSALAGVVAGGCGIFVGHPFDTLKTRMQVGKYFDTSKQYTRIQTIRQLYRGIVPPLLTAGFMQSINFSLYERFKKLTFNFFGNTFNIEVSDRQHHIPLYLSSVFFGGAISGSIISIIANPISLIKVQQQLATKKGVLDCAKNLYTKYGIMGFYRGYCCMFIMESYGRGVYLLTYEFSKLQYPFLLNSINNTLNNNNNNKEESIGIHYFDETSLLVRMMSAATAGCTSWLSIYPCDVIKTRMQLDIERVKYKSCIDCFFKILQEGGIRYLFRGIIYTLIRAAPVAATILPIYEYTKELCDLHLISYI